MHQPRRIAPARAQEISIDFTIHARGNGPNLERGRPFPSLARSGIGSNRNAGRDRRRSSGSRCENSRKGARRRRSCKAHRGTRSQSKARRNRLHNGRWRDNSRSRSRSLAALRTHVERVVDTAQALQIREASRLIEHGLVRMGEILERRAHEFQDTPQIGRTHGIHAEPITFGLKVANWFAENRRNLERFGHAAAQMAVGKISGAVGNASHLGPDVEASICLRLGLSVAPVASQVIQRDRHAQYLSALAILTATLEKIALEIRHLQRTEVREAEEPFGGEQRGSSAMPHKRNPVSSEQVCGLARIVRANAGAAFENIALWHERDISHSSVERVILPDSTILADYLLTRMADIVSGMRVFPERMRRNLDATGGLVFSGQLMLDLIESGAPREDAYKWVQEHAMAAWETETNFRQRVVADARIKIFLDRTLWKILST